jgi:hypothetical protein
MKYFLFIISNLGLFAVSDKAIEVKLRRRTPQQAAGYSFKTLMNPDSYMEHEKPDSLIRP